MLKIDDASEKLVVSFVLNEGVMLSGKFKVLSFGEEEIILSFKKQEIVIRGSGLIVKTLAKGEIVIAGKIKTLDCGD